MNILDKIFKRKIKKVVNDRVRQRNSNKPTESINFRMEWRTDVWDENVPDSEDVRRNYSGNSS